MIIFLKNANFNQLNIGVLSSWNIFRSLGAGATYEGPTSVDRDTALSATVTLAEGYEVGTAGITVTMGGTVLDESYYSIVDNVITFTIASVTGNVVIKVPTLNTNTGEEDVIPNYIFTINPTPIDATVTLSATGYSTVSGTGSKSITVANGTTVNWIVEASGYTTRTGSWTANGSDETKNVVLNSGDIAEYAIYDSFDRDNTDDGIGSTDTGETWQVIVGAMDANKTLLKIDDGKVKGNTTNKYPSAVVAATELDRYVEIEIADNAGSGQILLYDKYWDATNYIAARKGKDGIITLLKKINGTNTEVAKTTERYTDDNLVLAIQCIGNDHAVFANGTQILTGTISEFASATRVGFSINETNDTCDNFKVKYL